MLHGTWIIDLIRWRASRPCFPLIVSPCRPREAPLPDYTEAHLPLEFVLAFTYSLMLIRLDVVTYAKIASIQPSVTRITLWCARHEKSLSSTWNVATTEVARNVIRGTLKNIDYHLSNEILEFFFCSDSSLNTFTRVLSSGIIRGTFHEM